MPMSKTIMIIDDDDDDKDFFKLALTRVDPEIKCITAKDGVEALEILSVARELPDYIFLDLNMPRLGGKQCLAAMKRSDKLKHIPVIIYSTSKSREDEMETKKLGATHFFTKPTSIHDIMEYISVIFVTV
jgi:DNA-binding response OmpR family regulator